MLVKMILKIIKNPYPSLDGLETSVALGTEEVIVVLLAVRLAILLKEVVR